MTDDAEALPIRSPLPVEDDLVEVALAVHAHLEVDAVLEVVTEQARRLLGTRQAATYFRAPGASRCRLFTSLAGRLEGPVEEAPCDAVEALGRLERPVRLTAQQVAADPRWAPLLGDTFLGDTVLGDPARAGVLLAPLVGTGGETIGFIEVAAKTAGELDAADEARMASLARVAAVALGNANRYEAAIGQAASERFRVLIDASPVPIVEIDPSGTVVLWNRSAEEVFGWSRQEVVGQPLPLVPEDRREEHLEARRRVSSGEIVRMETVRLRKDGTRLEVGFAAAPIYAGGHLVGMIGIFADIGERKRLERRLGDVGRMEVIGRLAGGIAHDFNNLLTAITGHLEFLLENTDDDQTRVGLTEIQQLVERGSAFTAQLLAVGKRQVARPHRLDLGGLVRSFAPMLRRLVGEQVDVVVQDNGSLVVEADPVQLEQVLLNLAINARDAMPDGGVLTMATERAAGPGDGETSWACLSVTDTGVGIPPEHLDRIFEPFFTTKEPGRGTGLGLATVHGIVAQNRGRVSVDSVPGRTTFTVAFPEVDGP